MKKTLLILLSFFSISLFAQEESKSTVDKQEKKELYLFEFEDESEYMGEIIEDTPDKVTVKRMDGSIVNIPAYKIIKRTKVEEGRWDKDNQEYIYPNLHDSRYFFSPSAFPLDKGQGYYSTYWWYFWQAHFGITKNLSLGAGTSLLGMPSTIAMKYAINPKKEQSLKDITYAFGWFWVGNPIISSDRENIGVFGRRTWVNMPFGVMTFGDKEKNISIALGYNIKNQQEALPMVANIGSNYRIGRRLSFMFEAWAFNWTYKENTDNIIGIYNPDPQTITTPVIYGGPGFRIMRKKTKSRLWGIGSRNKGAGHAIIDFQLIMLGRENSNNIEGTTFEFIGPFPVLGTSAIF